MLPRHERRARCGHRRADDSRHRRKRSSTLLVHPDRHQDIDGSGTVRDAKGEAQRLEMGSKFGMSMHMGIPYSMVSTVIEYEENRRLAWQTTGPGAIGAHVGGRIWRYELEPVEGGTLVRESWDISQESAVHAPARAPGRGSDPQEHGRHARADREARHGLTASIKNLLAHVLNTPSRSICRCSCSSCCRYAATVNPGTIHTTSRRKYTTAPMS